MQLIIRYFLENLDIRVIDINAAAPANKANAA